MFFTKRVHAQTVSAAFYIQLPDGTEEPIELKGIQTSQVVDRANDGEIIPEAQWDGCDYTLNSDTESSYVDNPEDFHCAMPASCYGFTEMVPYFPRGYNSNQDEAYQDEASTFFTHNHFYAETFQERFPWFPFEENNPRGSSTAYWEATTHNFCWGNAQAWHAGNDGACDNALHLATENTKRPCELKYGSCRHARTLKSWEGIVTQQNGITWYGLNTSGRPEGMPTNVSEIVIDRIGGNFGHGHVDWVLHETNISVEPPRCNSLNITTTGESITQLQESDELTITANGSDPDGPPAWINVCASINNLVLNEKYSGPDGWTCYGSNAGVGLDENTTYSTDETSATLTLSNITYAEVRSAILDRPFADKENLTAEDIDNVGIYWVTNVADDTQQAMCSTNRSHYDPSNQQGSGIFIKDGTGAGRCDGDKCVGQIILKGEEIPKEIYVSKTCPTCVELVAPNNIAHFDIISTSQEDVVIARITDTLPIGFDFVEDSANLMIGETNLNIGNPEIINSSGQNTLIWQNSSGWPLNASEELQLEFDAITNAEATTGQKNNEVTIEIENGNPAHDTCNFPVEQTCSPKTGIEDSPIFYLLPIILIASGLYLYKKEPPRYEENVLQRIKNR